MKQESVRTVYAVAQGQYSDHHILCLFEQRKHAEAYIKSLADAEDKQETRRGYEAYHHDSKIEEYQLWSVVPTLRVEGTDVWPDINMYDPQTDELVARDGYYEPLVVTD